MQTSKVTSEVIITGDISYLNMRTFILISLLFYPENRFLFAQRLLRYRLFYFSIEVLSFLLRALSGKMYHNNSLNGYRKQYTPTISTSISICTKKGTM